MTGNSTFDDLTTFHLARQISRWGWEIGAHTYGNPLVLEPELAKLHVGKFCSIGPEVIIALGNHRTDLVTTYPFRALSKFWPNAESGEVDHESRGDVVIENDVWIGARSTILSGSKICNGAVVAANSLVRGHVPPYAIVAGSPAKIIRYRFDTATIQSLLSARWWSLSDTDIERIVPMLLSNDIDSFLASVSATDTGHSND